MHKSNIKQQHRLILDQLPADWIYDRDQWAILALDERAAIEALPRLLPADAALRGTNLLKATVAETGKLNADGQRRMSEVLHLLADGVVPRGTGEIAAG